LNVAPNLTILALDLSKMGVRLIIRDPLKEGLRVEILLHATGPAKPARRLGHVVWCLATAHGNNVVGIAFEKPLARRWWDANVSVPPAPA
jgi:hypothetical protein